MGKSVYDIVTERIIEQLKSGFIPWKKPWNSKPPMNFINKIPYHGANIILLANNKFQSRYFLTMNQCNKLGYKIKKDEKAFMIVFYKMIEKKDSTKEKKEFFPMLRYHNVWNVEQTTIPLENIPKDNDNEKIPQVEDCVTAYLERTKLRMETSTQACYSPTLDVIRMPLLQEFVDSNQNYHVLFHELVHSTGHPSRLNRKLTGEKGSPDYAREELIAELGASFCSDRMQIVHEEIKENQAAYIQSWLKALENDKTLVVKASGKAQKACEFIIDGKVPNNK